MGDFLVFSGQCLHSTSGLTNMEHKHLDSLFIVLEDFNQANLSKELSKYIQNVKCPTSYKAHWTTATAY